MTAWNLPMRGRILRRAAYAGFGIALTWVAQPAWAHGPALGQDRAATLSVSGSAVTSVEPDRVAIRFGVETQDETSALALAANSELMAQVIDSLRDADVGQDEISTARFDIQPVYESQVDRQTGQRSQVLIGYRVSNQLQVDTGRLGEVGKILDAAVAAGVNRVDHVQFFLAPERMKRVQAELIEAAVHDARRRAEMALAAAGQRITGVRQMSIDDMAVGGPQLMNFARMEMDVAAPTQILAGDQEVRAHVSVTYLIGPDPQREN